MFQWEGNDSSHGQMLESSADMLSPSDSSMKLPNFNQKALSIVTTV